MTTRAGAKPPPRDLDEEIYHAIRKAGPGKRARRRKIDPGRQSREREQMESRSGWPV
ncbi:MAG: hypothetical protein JW838_05675 [Spirochaetes bacterium]|nr:hypothetical protein [Spirochaetota bacterium]